jgi:hypothetical protein
MSSSPSMAFAISMPWTAASARAKIRAARHKRSEWVSLTAKALCLKLTDAQAGRALDPVLEQIAKTTGSGALQGLAKALTALAPKLAAAKAREVWSKAQASLAWAASDKEAADWARALVALLDRAGDPERIQKMVALVAYPTAAGAATDILIDAVRAPEAAAPTKEAGTNAALEWLFAASYRLPKPLNVLNPSPAVR